MGASNAASHGIDGHDEHGSRLVVHDASAHAFTSGSAARRKVTCTACCVT